MLFVILPILISVAFLTLLERKVLRLVGVRVGPNKVSFYGFLQPIGDALKLANKQVNILRNFSFFFYYLRRILMFVIGTIIWATCVNSPCAVSFKFGILLLLIILGINSLNSVIRGWRSFGKYPLIGSLRTVSQLISYEAVLYLCIFFLVFFYTRFSFDSLNFFPFDSFIIFFPLVFILWLPSFLAELNRTPYDFSEGERELVRGFNTDFGSLRFTFIFLAEYRMILFFCFLTNLFFLKRIEFFFFFFFFLRNLNSLSFASVSFW